MAQSAEFNLNSGEVLTLEAVRDVLTRQEDTIIFSLIERAKFPFNSNTYSESYADSHHGFHGSLVELIVRNAESTQALAGRYGNPEENPFFPEHLPRSLVPPYPFPQVLHPVSASVNINKSIWKFYFEEFLPLFVAPGDDGNYAQTAASDLQCLQAISRRIHYGKFVAEVKFRESPQDYEPPIRTQDTDALMNLLTFTIVEEMVKRRVQKKAMVFGQTVTLNATDINDSSYKVDPSVVGMLYDKWIVPLTKQVEVEYLLRRLE